MTLEQRTYWLNYY